MKPLLYCYIDQINSLLTKVSDWGFNSHFGITFEKKDEHVYHVYTDAPDVIPAGVPLPTVFSILTYSQSRELNPIDACSKLRAIIKSKFNKIPKIFLFLTKMGNGKASVKGYIETLDSFNETIVKYVPGKDQLHSRSKGILEHSLLENSSVAIVGLGSFGSYVAVELAKAGVGNFHLFDFDRLELSNVVRHQCGIDDLGRFKTNAVRDLIKLKNPYANIFNFEIDINREFGRFINAVKESDVLLCLTDNNESRNRVNEFCIKNKKVVIFARAITRAEGGDVFILDGKNIETAPCLTCLVGMGLFKKAEDEKTQFARIREETPAYVSDEDIEATIQVGLSSDINPICNMVVKLTLLELCKNKQSGLETLYQDLTARYYLWVNRREDKYKNWQPMEFYANKPSILRWYGAKLKKDPICPSCNPEAFLDSQIEQ